MKSLKKVLLILLILLLLILAGTFLYRHFVTNRISDRGGMENPDIQMMEMTEDQEN